MSIKTDIESGGSLAEALNKRPMYFDELFCNLVEAGEQAGVLETLLEKSPLQGKNRIHEEKDQEGIDLPDCGRGRCLYRDHHFTDFRGSGLPTVQKLWRGFTCLYQVGCRHV